VRARGRVSSGAGGERTDAEEVGKDDARERVAEERVDLLLLLDVGSLADDRVGGVRGGAADFLVGAHGGGAGCG